MKLRGEKDFKAEELYELLSDEISNSFLEYVRTIKESSLEELNNYSDIVNLVEEEQPVRYCVFSALLNADLDLDTLKVLVNIENKHKNLIESLYKRLNCIKERVNIFNTDEVTAFVLDSINLLVTYYDLEDGEENETSSTL